MLLLTSAAESAAADHTVETSSIQVTCCPVEMVSESMSLISEPIPASELESDSGNAISEPESPAPLVVPTSQEIISPPLTRAETLESIVCAYQWGPRGCAGALRVVFCESSNNPAAFDGYNSGWFQVARKWHERRLRADESLFDPVVNTRVANEIFREQGSGPWPYCGRFF